MKAVKVLLMTVFLAGALSADVTATDEEVCEYLVGSWIARGMIDSLGAYGTAEQLPFLYSQITNAINELVAYPEADLPE